MGITLAARRRMKWGIGKLSSRVVIDIVCPSSTSVALRHQLNDNEYLAGGRSLALRWCPIGNDMHVPFIDELIYP
jgi:hypothetical protein